MTVKVVYYSKGGNTEKLARAVAKGAGAIAESAASAAITEPVDLLFIGAAIYAGNIDKQMGAFLDGLDPTLVKRAAIFGNAFREVDVQGRVSARLEPKGIAVEQTSFFCRGSFLLANRGRPNDDDLREAEAFAAGLVRG